MSRKNKKNTHAILRDAAPLRSQAHIFIRDKIIRGDYKPGARIKERELIEALGVSRTVIREAIRQLEDVNKSADQNADSPVRFLPALTCGLSYYLSMLMVPSYISSWVG